MRKLLLSLGVGLVSLVGLTANAATTASGPMTANNESSTGEFKTYGPVTAVYSATNSTLTLTGVANKFSYPLVMNIDSEGNLVSKAGQLSEDGGGIDIFYSDCVKKDKVVYGKIVNGVNSATITLNAFGDYVPDFDPNFFYNSWYNTRIELDNTIDFDDNGGGTVDPTPGDTKNLFVGTRNGSGLWEFDETNPLGVKFAMSFYKSTSYGNYNKLTWTTYSNYTYSQKDGKYLFVVPATYNPETGRYVINDYSDLRKNHIRFDGTADSKQVYAGLYGNTLADQSGALMENVYVVVASYTDYDRSELIAVEKAYALKGGEFKGATDGSFPDLVSGTLDNGKKYQWELLFDEIEVIQPDPDPEGTGNITATGWYWETDPRGWAATEVNSTVKGRYYLDTKVLKVTGIQMKEGKTRVFDPLELTLDPTTGNVEAKANEAYFANSASHYYANWNDVETNAIYILTGKIENTGENESTLTLTDWGDIMYWAGSPYQFNQTHWVDTKIVFPFAIPDLPAYVEPEPEPITGKANFTATYQPWNGSSYPISKVVNFTYDDNKITIPGTEINSTYTDDLILPIDWDTMTIKTQYCWCYTYQNALPVYYADYYPSTESSKRTGWLTGTVQNVDGKTIITLSTWGELMWYQGAASGYYGDGTWANTQIEFSLANEPEPEPGDNTLPLDEGFTPLAKTAYTFTPTEDGVLTLTKEGGDDLYPSFISSALLSANGKAVEPSYDNGDPENLEGSTIIKWNLEAGTTYVFYYDVNKNPEEIGTFTFTFKAGAEEPAIDYATLNISGVENILIAFDLDTEDMVELSETMEVKIPEDGTGIIFVAEEGYEITISCDEDNEDGAYTIIPVNYFAEATGTQLMLGLYPAAIGYEFNITVEKPKIATFTVEGNNYKNLEYAALTLEEFMGDPTDIVLQAMTSDSFDVKLGAGEGPTNVVILKPAEGYTMNITSDVPEYAGEGTYTWQNMSIMMGDVEATTQVMLGIGEGAIGASFSITLTEPEPEINALVFEDFEMELGANPTTVEVPVSIQADEEFTYQGIQFTVTLPEGLTLDNIVLNTPLEGTLTKYYDEEGDVYGEPNTTGVVVLLNEPTEAVEDILTLNVTGKYGDIEEGRYPITIQEVGFSDGRGNDIETPEFEDFTGYVTIIAAEVPAKSITIDSVTLNEPSFTEEESDMVEEVVQGESVTMTITVEPEDTTDELEWSADVEGVEFDYDPETGECIIDTSGVVVPEGQESVTVTITIKANDDVEVEYELTVRGVLLGDSNDNGKVTVADVVTTANYIAKKPILAFCFPNANVILTPENGEQVINAQDLTATINIVLLTWDGKRELNARRHANRSFSNDRLVADNFHAGHNNIGINLENTVQYAALQATIEIPAGMKVENVTAGQRAANHELVYHVTGNELHVVLFSYTNEAFANGEGSLFNISVSADENCGDLVMTNILASDANSNGYELASEGGMQTETTGINGIGSEEGNVRYFTVDGVEVVNPEKGQILIRVQNGEAVKVLVK